jgi:hypothetical protein
VLGDTRRIYTSSTTRRKFENYERYDYIAAAHPLFVYFRKAYDLVWQEVLCNIVTESSMPTKLVSLNVA